MVRAAGKGILLVRRLLSLLVIGLVIGGTLPLSVAVAAPPAKGAHKVIVQNTDAAARKSVEQGGGTLLADYGAFSLYALPGTSAQAQSLAAARETVRVRDDLNLIQLRGGAIDTTSGAAPVAANVRQAKAGGRQLWFVQFVGPVMTAWLDNLRKLGIEIVAYVPNNAYIVWLDGGQLAQLESLEKSDPTIQWTGAYHPHYRLAPNHLQRRPDDDQFHHPDGYADARLTHDVSLYRLAGRYSR